MGEVFSIKTRRRIDQEAHDPHIQANGQKNIKSLYETLKDAKSNHTELACLMYAANEAILDEAKGHISDADIDELRRCNCEAFKETLKSLEK